MGFLGKYWKKIGLVILGMFLTVSPLFFMFYVGILAGHFITARFDWKLDIRVRTPRRKGATVKLAEAEADTEDLEDLPKKDLIPEPKTVAESPKVFEHTEQPKEDA